MQTQLYQSSKTPNLIQSVLSLSHNLNIDELGNIN